MSEEKAAAEAFAAAQGTEFYLLSWYNSTNTDARALLAAAESRKEAEENAAAEKAAAEAKVIYIYILCLCVCVCVCVVCVCVCNQTCLSGTERGEHDSPAQRLFQGDCVGLVKESSN